MLLAWGTFVHGTATAAQVCTTTGVQNIAVLIVTFPGVALPANVTPQSVHDTFFGVTGRSLDGYWREASYGKTSAAGDVFGTYTLSQAYTCSTGGQMLNEAMSIAASQGANFQNYTRIFVIYPNIGCTAGFAQVGCSQLSTPSGTVNASAAYIEADYIGGDLGVALAAHEGGHNLGLQHADTRGFGSEPLGPLGAAGTLTDMGDYASVMGSTQYLGHYSAQHKAEILGWLAGGTNYQVVQSSGTWSIQPLEVSPAGLQALKIQRGTGNNSWLWVEYRQPLGYDASISTQPFTGALVYYEDSSTGAFTNLLDFTPDGTWNSWWYPTLQPGSTWTDPYSNLSITVQGATPSALTVSVNYGASACTPGNPLLTMSPATVSLAAGASATYTVSVTNTDSAGCSPNTFNLSTSLPSGWASSLSAASIKLSPGQSGTVTITKTAPLTASGSYQVDATAVSAAASGAASAIASIIAPFSATLSIPKSSYAPKQTVAMSAKVSGSGSGGANVTFTLKKADGSTTTKKVKADYNGGATWNYTVSSRDPAGSYAAGAVAVGGLKTAVTNTVGFVVQ